MNYKLLFALAALTILSIMPTGFETSAQTSPDAPNTVETDSTSSPFFKIFSEYRFDLPAESEFIRADQIKYYQGNNKNQTSTMSTYRLPSGELISGIIEDSNNYIWFHTPTQTNQITGETEPVAETSNNIIAFKRMVGDVAIAYSPSENGYYYIYFNVNPDCEYGIVNPRAGNLDFSFWGSTNTDNYLSRLYNKAVGKTYNSTGILNTFSSKDEAEKFANGWWIYALYDNNILPFKPYAKEIRTYSGTGAEIAFLHLTDPETTPIAGDAEKVLLQVEPQMGHLDMKLYVQNDKPVLLSTKDVVTSIKEDGNIITLEFKQPGDFLKYSLYASNLFDGKLTRKNGYLDFKNDRPKDGGLVTYFNNEPMQLEHYDPNYPSRKLGVIMVPGGLHSMPLNIEKCPSVITNYDTNNQIFFKSAKLEAWFYDDANTHVLTTYLPGAIFHKDGVKIARQQDQALVREEQAALAAVKNKYGASVVENIMKGSIKVGMPWSVVKEAFPYTTMSSSKYSTIYRVMNNIPQIDRRNKKFTKVNFGLGQVVYVTVRFGKVADVYYSGHN